MPERSTIKKAQRDKRAGRSASTQAGEFVREEMHHIREGKHGARSAKQAIAIGLSKAREAGVAIPKKAGGTAPKRAGKHIHAPAAPAPKRSRATSSTLKKEGRSAASHEAISHQVRSAAKGRTAGSRSAAAKKAARAKGASGRSAAAKKAARTRARKD